MEHIRKNVRYFPPQHKRLSKDACAFVFALENIQKPRWERLGWWQGLNLCYCFANHWTILWGNSFMLTKLSYKKAKCLSSEIRILWDLNKWNKNKHNSTLIPNKIALIFHLLRHPTLRSSGAAFFCEVHFLLTLHKLAAGIIKSEHLTQSPLM